MCVWFNCTSVSFCSSVPTPFKLNTRKSGCSPDKRILQDDHWARISHGLYKTLDLPQLHTDGQQIQQKKRDLSILFSPGAHINKIRANHLHQPRNLYLWHLNNQIWESRLCCESEYAWSQAVMTGHHFYVLFSTANRICQGLREAL